MEATGERFIPELMGGELIQAEHVVRYQFAAQMSHGRRVLDAGCGVGWGSEVLLPGAVSVTGIDIDPEAVSNATNRVPAATFVVADLAALPWPDDSFELVVCFEAIEHVTEQERVLDELVRVLAPGGILMVSSPNPRVYPPGNPFHVHELSPEELSEALAERLPHTALWSQHVQVASALIDSHCESNPTQLALMQFVAPLAGTDPYSLCIASAEPLESLTLAPVIACASAAQLVHLQESSEQLADARSEFAQHQLEVQREREQILAERSQHLAALRDADAGLVLLTTQRTELTDRVAAMSAQIERLREDCGNARAERERLSWLLLQTQQQLASNPPSRLPQLTTDAEDLEIDMLRQVVDNLYAEVAGLRASTSWRLTRPLRAISGKVRRSGS